MKYFIMKQEKQIGNLIKLRDFKGNKHITFTKDQENKLNDVSTLFVTGNQDSVYTDFIENPLFLISDELKKIFEIYEHTLLYKTVVLSNIQEKVQKVYHMVLTDKIDCLSDQTTFYKNGWEKDIVLDKDKLQNHNIFQIEGTTGEYLIVVLDMAESILRRDFVGMSFEEIEVI
ncbi:imm11 family protein [Marinisporobacter balticus]|uniref:Uncharacterized protein n=1 Tax=Marinisporobacter balticus TaxID=2018667 RepID=A0A4R2KNB9_9FIRM|nr:hypothetical protein [Marinisporobacter balticus]TCO68075.1 hypothetical protein EV214_1499 [Marinisporobacter balticus]